MDIGLDCKECTILLRTEVSLSKVGTGGITGLSRHCESATAQLPLFFLVKRGYKTSGDIPYDSVIYCLFPHRDIFK